MNVSENTRRLTAARLYVTFAVVAFIFALLALSMRGGRNGISWIDYPTALGDTDFYTSLGENDLYEPNLTWEGLSGGVFRQTEEPLEMDDAKMKRVTREAGGRVTVYTFAEGEGSEVVYLKAGDGLYHRFGERKLWPPWSGSEEQ